MNAVVIDDDIILEENGPVDSVDFCVFLSIGSVPISEEVLMPAFTIHASKGGQSIATVRISSGVTVAKARSLADAGWDVHVTDVDGRQHGPDTWDDLLISGPNIPHSLD